MFKWLSGREAAQVGTALADDFVLETGSGSGARERDPRATHGQKLQKFMDRFLKRVDRETRPLKLNIFKRATLANSFKWRLLEKGVEKSVVEELTQALVLRLTTGVADAPLPEESAAASKRRLGRDAVQALLVEGTQHAARGAEDQAVECFQHALTADPGNVFALNNLGLALCRLGRYHEAGEQFRKAIGVKPNYAEAHCNLGSLLRSLGRFSESEQPLRRALKLKPTLIEAQVSLGATLYISGRLKEARALFERALKVAPRHVEALTSLGQLCALDGRFAEAETWFNRAREIDPKTWLVWVGLAGLRRMTAADGDWLKGAQASADSHLTPLNEASVRYAIAKYYDQVGDYAQAFRSLERAKELVRTAAVLYNREGRVRFGDALMRTYTPATLTGPKRGASDSSLPVLVIGMPRSGTSLVEQIVASHPAVSGAGEVEFWGPTVLKHEAKLLNEPPDEAIRRKLAEGYLRMLTANSGNAARVVDKSPFNSEYLGIIHSVFPNARVIYVRRDPRDTCLSCYFQDFPPLLNFTLDLSDLAHFYRNHHRLMEHWRRALPAGTLLDVPYEKLIADQEGWTRRVLEFLGLPWDERCLNFHSNERSVLTASFWQVRQKVYQSSVGRWRHYEKFIRPLLELKGLD
jgi:tetratricopeptide (TPR) repeat protein